MGGGVSKDVHDSALASHEKEISEIKRKFEAVSADLNGKIARAQEEEKALTARVKELHSSSTAAISERNKLTSSFESLSKIKEHRQDGVWTPYYTTLTMKPQPVFASLVVAQYSRYYGTPGTGGVLTVARCARVCMRGRVYVRQGVYACSCSCSCVFGPSPPPPSLLALSLTRNPPSPHPLTQCVFRVRSS